jgi:hypothetical protein
MLKAEIMQILYNEMLATYSRRVALFCWFQAKFKVI